MFPGIHRLRQLAKYLGRFGARGLSIWIARHLKTLSSVNVPDVAHPIFLRGNGSDWLVFDDLFLRDFYALPEMPSPKLIIDAGANTGILSSIWASKFPGAKIIAIEPDKQNFELLKKNTQAYPNVVRLQAAVWSGAGTMTIRNPDADFWGFEVEESEHGDIEAITVMDLLKLSGLEKIDILKIDIEGAEKEVFEAGSVDQWLALTAVLFVETHDRMKRGCSRAVFNRVISFEFDQWIIGDTIRFDFHHATVESGKTSGPKAEAPI